MLEVSHQSIIELPEGCRPLLSVVVDTEEEFGWGPPFARIATNVSNIASQFRAHEIFDRYGVTPVYVVDYPVASQSHGAGPLREFHQAGKCEIGSHLHPWVNPPFDEELTPGNSFPGNLDFTLEREKLARLTEVIHAGFGVVPKIYRAGRYGVGASTGDILEELGYEVDTSVLPSTDLRRIHGPDFSAIGAKPYVFGRSRLLLEVPLSVAWTGAAPWIGRKLNDALQTRIFRATHLQGIFARTGLCEHIRLTPEGITFDEMRRLTLAMMRSGHRAFVLSYHSPSLVPGNTPYVRDGRELAQFLERIEQYLDFFTRDLRGRPIEMSALAALLLRQARLNSGIGIQPGSPLAAE
jgi:hypothetical protein